MGNQIKTLKVFLLAMSLLGIAGCFDGFKSAEAPSLLASSNPVLVESLDGAGLYSNNCAGCHGPLENSTKQGRTPEEILNAFRVIPQMTALNGRLGANEIEAISLALEPTEQTSPFNSLCETLDIQRSMPTARRLSKFEYFASIEDLFGINQASLNADFPEDLVSEGFNNQEDSLVVSRNHVRAFGELARSVSNQVNIGNLVSQNTNCTQTNSNCFNQFINNLGLKVFRRPPEARVRDRLRAVGEFVVAEGGNFNEASKYILTAMLQLPEFLYRLEKSNNSNQLRDADGYEMASRLSFLIWQSAPDAALLEEARQKRLRTDSQIQAQVRRLLQSNKAKRGFRNYIRTWLGLDQLGGFDIADGKYPLLNSQLLDDMEAQVIKHYEELVFTDERNLVEAITDEHAFLNSRLGQLYGVSVNGGSLVKRSTASLQNRVGIFSYPALLMRPLASDNPSIVQRGKFINETFLCNHPPDPPPDVPDDPVLPGPGLSQRDNLEVHRNNVSCASCHATIDGPGLAFDTFNTIGQFRLVDEANNDLFTSGDWNLKGTELSWNNTKQFVTSVASSPVTRLCMTEKVFQFGLGRALSLNDSCAAETITKEIGLENTTYQKIIEATALSSSFRKSGGREN
ncbi:MAG: DUF1592 domain-containing protein [Pseudomonadota bacterium]